MIRPILFLLLAAGAVQVCALERETPPAPVAETPALALGAFATLDAIVPALVDKRVVFIGEQHTRYDHHLIQLEIIRRLHARHPRLAIGVEFFQQPFQASLDDYLAGTIDEKAMLRATGYFQRWRMDYRHYAPILQYARAQGLPVIALNVPTELTRKVGRVGLDGLSDAERQQLPADIAPADAAYRERIEDVFQSHPRAPGKRFEHFLQAQLLWDEGMAERAAEFLETHPDHHLVVIAGNQHVAWGTAIPQRLQRRLTVSAATILNSWEGPLGPGLADYLLMPEERTLPPAGRIGALLDDDEERVTVASCFKDGACAAAGIRKGDRITAIDNHDIHDTTDLRLALWGKQPGDTISMDIMRKRFLLPSRQLSFELTLK